jgi:hypothetical protein
MPKHTCPEKSLRYLLWTDCVACAANRTRRVIKEKKAVKRTPTPHAGGTDA